MIIFNILIFLIFIALFAVSAKRGKRKSEESFLKRLFADGAEYIVLRIPIGSGEMRHKQRMLNPSEDPESASKKFWCRITAEALMILFAGNLLSFIVGIQSVDSGKLMNSISRNSYGKGDQIVSMEVKSSGRRLKDPIDFKVSERKYTEDEIQSIFKEIKEALPKIMLAENRASSHVDSDLNFVKSYKSYPVEIEWYPDNFECVNSEGKIDEDLDDEAGVRINIRASLVYENFYDDINMPVTVFPRRRTGEEKLRFEIRKALEKADKASESEDKVILPEKAGENEVSFFNPVAKTGMLFLLLSVMASAGIIAGRNDEIKKGLLNREQQMKADYPKIVSRLALLLGAGMTIRGAFEKTAADYEKDRKMKKGEIHYAYEEMLITVRLMKSGTGEMTAYQEFGARSGVAEYRKLGTMLSQNLKKGSSGILALLEYEAANAFENRKSEARRLGEEAGTKLLLPMGIMLLIVLLIILVPSVMSFGF
ncbi:MAG: type II secretion system F family protein [Lachnospiraceae bacterium]|nr:type II secretion system F family protein [Lachnospiraceae bacterium]